MKTVLVRAAMAALLIATGPAEAGHYMAGPAEVGHHVGRAAEVRHHAAGPAEIGHRVLTADVLAASRRPEIVEGQDAHLTFTVGSATAGRGHKAYGVLKVPAGKDAGYDIPVVVLHGARPGPVLAVASGAHGTEYASIIAVERLIDAVDPAQLSGTLILVPLINVPSFERIVPHVNPTDNKSMNRFYPGDPNGTQTDRASFVVTREVVDKCDHLIDLHGGDLDENLRPYSYWTVTGNQKQDAISRAMVLAFGLDHIIISADRPKDPKASRYLENTASTRGKPSFTAEAGRSGPVDPKDAAVLVTGVQNVMGHLKMLSRAAPAPAKPVWVGQIVTVAADREGIFHPAVDRDAHVVKGAKIGSVTDYLNRPLQDVLAPESGIIMFVRALPSLKKGDTIANVGVVSTDPR
ncbi:MAG: succinylglutamate desuccinylase [Acidobacteria bacterium]|nr:MAG: succinylglutamate desuccinylase [Acidobacteriota bacterium]PYR48344.1 MAG: succinylglutamate desuccinylase [Acidobacteriota bacterium]